MLALKNYQQRALDSLRRFFDETTRICERMPELDAVKIAFENVTRDNFREELKYTHVAEMRGLPYVCLRLPTGGGKTIVACHAAGITKKHLLMSEHAVVLWLVPSNTIREQTLKALRDKSHPYRQALEAEAGEVLVLDDAESLTLKRADVQGATVFIVATMQAFRVEDTEGRKVYEANGMLMEHFERIDAREFPHLERYRETEKIKFSFANVLQLNRPIVIVDEAHNARTSLSFDTLARFRPSCIIELSATPRIENLRDGEKPSNVLHSTSAAELKAEEMIKLPVRLHVQESWRELLAAAVHQREELERIADAERNSTREYIRPVMLVGAEKRSGRRETLTVDVVKRELIENCNVLPEHVVIATGEVRGLDGVDILSFDCPIRYVITVDALREGWDCPFAYVLCSIAEMNSPVAIEQLLGRVLRMPNAKRKSDDALNVAYAFARSREFGKILATFKDALIANGFEKQEAKDLIKLVASNDGGFSLPFEGAESPTANANTITAAPIPEIPRLETLAPDLRARVAYNSNTGELAFRGVMSRDEQETLSRSFQTPEARAAIERIFHQTQMLDAIQTTDRANDVQGNQSIVVVNDLQREPFRIPALAIKQDDFYEIFDESHICDFHWRLSKCDALLSEKEFGRNGASGILGEIDVMTSGRIETRFLENLQRDLASIERSFDDENTWTPAALVHWLDREIPHSDITPTESGIFLNNLIHRLTDERDFTLQDLARERFRLRRAVEDKINLHRRDARLYRYQSLLDEDATEITVTPDVCFTFAPHAYPYGFLYSGNYKFVKHFHPDAIGDLKAEGEEHDCAQFIDRLPAVRRWIRNTSGHAQHSFWLQTSKHKFYPDFVCQLHDNRFLVVEYKGKHLYEDAEEKRDLGELWAKRSGGKCVFTMPTEKNFATIEIATGN